MTCSMKSYASIREHTFTLCVNPWAAGGAYPFPLTHKNHNAPSKSANALRVKTDTLQKWNKTPIIPLHLNRSNNIKVNPHEL